MNSSKNNAAKVADFLLQINAVKLQPSNPLNGHQDGIPQFIVTIGKYLHIQRLENLLKMNLLA